MSHFDETDEILKYRQLRKRGRKNKYQSLIDIEDDKEDMQAREEDEYLKLLAEQQAEEESLKHLVTQSLRIQKEINASK